MTATYLAGIGMITATGGDSRMVYHSDQCGINRYQSANYHSSNHHQIKMALVPDEALPPLSEALEFMDMLSLKSERILLMSQTALAEALDRYPGDSIPLVMSYPRHADSGFSELDHNFLRCLPMQCDLPIDYANSRMIYTGRTGVMDAIKLANLFLHTQNHEFVLVGGADSCQDSDWLEGLDKQGRLKTDRLAGHADGFVPGEGAGFLLLTSNPDYALKTGQYNYLLTEPGFGMEPGHVNSDKPYLGQGLDRAFKQALSKVPPEKPLGYLYSSMNGEHYWVKELGVAMSRADQNLSEVNHQHPAEAYGDVGAATGAVLIGLACLKNAYQQLPESSLIYCSSDQHYRAAVCLLAERSAA